MKKIEFLVPLNRNLKELFLTMKLCLLFLLISAASLMANSSYSQNTTLSIHLKNATLRDLISEVEKQSEFIFVFYDKVINLDKQIDIDADKQTIDKILNEIFKSSELTYRIFDRQIGLGKRDPVTGTIELPAPLDKLMAVDKILTGVVKDTKGAPVTGASVVVKGTTIGTVTDTYGNFTLSLPPDAKSIVISFVGMKAQEIVIGNRTSMSVILTDETVEIDEIVSIGYGTTKKTTVTGSISTVSGKKLLESPSVNVANTLAGRLPGLVVVQSSGEPGNDSPTIRVRGSNTLGDNSPLIVVDGVSNRSLVGIKSEDIQDITVLKDASAAIYGAQAANGVILITTKRGAEGRPEITVKFDHSYTAPTVLPKMADAATYATMVDEIQGYYGVAKQYTPEEIQKFKDGSDPWKYPNTDWFAETYTKFSEQSIASASLTGGTDKLKYFFSSGYQTQNGNFKHGITNYTQGDFRSNIDATISIVKLSVDIAGRQENRLYPTSSSGGIFDACLMSYPTSPAFYPTGEPGPDIRYGLNPVVVTTNQPGYSKMVYYYFNTNVKAVITIPGIKGLTINGDYAIDKLHGRSKLWEQPWYLYSWDKQSYDSNNQPVLVRSQKGLTDPYLKQTMGEDNKITLYGTINYEHKFGRHGLKVMAGSERVTGNTMSEWSSRRYFISTSVQELFAGGDALKDNGGNTSSSARLNYFGRANYDYLEKYLVEFVCRYDGSYIFPKNHRFGFFPGFSLGWRASEEEFWKKNLSFVSYFKLRGSWGQTGNDRIETYQYMSNYGLSDPYIFNYGTEVKTFAELRVPNTSITWEVANQANIGFDAHFLKDKLSLSFDYFHNERDKILYWRNASVPATTGISLPRENIGEVVNRGFEFQIGYNNKAGDFTYNVSANGAYSKNKIKFWDETPGVPEYQKSTGHPMGSSCYYQAIGIFKDQAAIDAYPHWGTARPGDIIFKDVNDDKVINGLDAVRDDRSSLPTFTGGLNIDLGYKKFYATLFFQGAAGAMQQHVTESGLFGNFLLDDANGRWTPDNTDAKKPRAWDTFNEYWRSNMNTYWLRSTDYLRLKTLQVGYNMPSGVNAKLGVKALRVYISGQNLFTMTKLKDFDPEWGGYTYMGYPPLKVYNLGVSLTF